jgi:ABC-type antimicrobial peptide transport system permease subunit
VKGEGIGKRRKEHKPPKWAQRFIAWYCKPGLAEDLIGDLNEYFQRNVQSLGPRRAKLIYLIDALKFLRWYTLRRPKFFNPLINTIMIGSYIKTSARSVMRHKLFSFINIVGLAISMSVGLLLIAFLLDLRSYDRFHTKGDRIFRITNILSSHEQNGKFATTSVRTGKLIRENVTGIEDAVIVRYAFTADAKVGDDVFPVKPLYTEPSLFRVFSFRLLEGNPETALRDPYSVVLTQTTSKRVFGNESALGKVIRFDTLDYQVTGIMEDVPFFSHLNFEALFSLSTAEQLNKGNQEFEEWTNMWSNYVYLLLPENADINSIRSQLDAIAYQENLAQNTNASQDNAIRLDLLPLHSIVVGENLREFRRDGSPTPHISPTVLWMLGGLALVVILSACINYTNLSIARALRRLKEVGVRKAIGAGKSQVRQQVLTEAIVISLLALVLSYLIFLFLRPHLINLAPEMQRMVKLELTAPMIIAFVAFSILVGVMAGLMPAVFFSKVSAINAFRNVTQVKLFGRMSFRRALVVLQYTVTLIFITTTTVGHVQYKNILGFDLGFSTENVLNIAMQGNNPDLFLNELREMPETTALSRSLIVTGVGNYWGAYAKYNDPSDSVLVATNHVDENYLPLHGYEFLAGGNFIARPTTMDAAREVIVNQQVLKRFNIGSNDPSLAIGEEITLNGKKVTIVGVMKDFHYGKVDKIIEPVALMFWTPENGAIINAKIQSDDMVATMARIESTWKKIDRVHPLRAEFYDETIEEAYSELSAMVKIIGFLSFLAVSIASMGLLGMVVFTTETRLKEISIRKVMGASSGNLVYLLSRGFLALLSVSAFIALPATYIFFENIVLIRFPYHTPVQITELFAGLLIVLMIAFIMIGSQTIKAARTNPAEVLKSE